MDQHSADGPESAVYGEYLCVGTIRDTKFIQFTHSQRGQSVLGSVLIREMMVAKVNLIRRIST